MTTNDNQIAYTPPAFNDYDESAPVHYTFIGLKELADLKADNAALRIDRDALRTEVADLRAKVAADARMEFEREREAGQHDSE